MRKSNILSSIPSLIILASLFLSSCAPKPTAAPNLTATVTIQATNTDLPTPTQTATNIATVTSTSIPFPSLTLVPGNFYFNLDGKASFIFSRNIAGYQQVHYQTFLDWARTGGSKVARIQLDSMGMGYTQGGEVDPNWVVQWDQVFDKAEADGIYVLPVFSGWFDWNAGAGYSTWKTNPLNQANGGPVKSPGELFQKGSATQTLWMKWMQTLVKRWQGRNNILGWEIFSEVNLASGNGESSGIDFVNSAAAIIRAADPAHRPVTASLADDGKWPNFYRDSFIDFINIHPYPPSAQLDRNIISGVRNLITMYKRPVLIGESGLNADTPDNYPPNAATGVRHAIWAGVVSGAMNGRALYWEDSFGIYFPNLGIPWMQKFPTELPAANFVAGVDFSGFQALTATFSSGVWGASVGNEKMVLSWYRDATSEPPDWNMLGSVSKQTVNLTVPGTAVNWQVDFYDTQTGTKIISASVTRVGNIVSVPLPDFKDDIAFKMNAQAGTASTVPPATITTDTIAETWGGTISNLAGTFSTLVRLSFQAGCKSGEVCGTFSAPQLPCAGDLFLQAINNETFLFQEQNVSGGASCLSGGYEQIQLLAGGKLSYQYLTVPGSATISTGILNQP